MARKKSNLFLYVLSAVILVLIGVLMFSDINENELQEPMSVFNVGNTNTLYNKTIIRVYTDYPDLTTQVDLKLVSASPTALYSACNRAFNSTLVNGHMQISCTLNSADMYSSLNTVSPWFIAVTYSVNGTYVEPIYTNMRAVEIDGTGCTASDCAQYKIISMVVTNQ